jgi:phenylalanyl-tRNA synthetase beta chain
MEDDLVEEVARVVGYDELPTTMLSTQIPFHQPDPPQELKERVRDLMAAAGFQEVVSYPLLSRDILERVGSPVKDGDGSHIRVSNPMSLEREWLRQDLRPSLLTALSTNWRHEEGPILLFEMGRGYLPRTGELPEERQIAGGVLMGPQTPPSWHAQPDSLAFYDAKGTVEALLRQLHIQAQHEPIQDQFFQPGRAARIVAGGEVIGLLGEVHPSVLERFDISRGPVALFELDLAALLKAAPEGSARFQRLPRFPGALRDLALLVDLETPASRVQEIIEAQALVAEATLFDVYTGSQVGDGVRSLAYRVLFQATDRTLTAEEVSQALEELVATLSREIGATQRQG